MPKRQKAVLTKQEKTEIKTFMEGKFCDYEDTLNSAIREDLCLAFPNLFNMNVLDEKMLETISYCRTLFFKG